MTNEVDRIQRVIELERRMDYLFEYLKIEAPRPRPEAGEAILGGQELLDGGQKIAAISLIVSKTGMSMAEARRTVDQMEGGS